MSMYKVILVIVLGVSLLFSTANASVTATASTDSDGVYVANNAVDESFIQPGNVCDPAGGLTQRYWMSSPMATYNPEVPANPIIDSTPNQEWFVADLGWSQVLDYIDIWNYYEDASWAGTTGDPDGGFFTEDRGVQEYALWIAGPGAATPVNGDLLETPFSAMDGWTQVSVDTFAQAPPGSWYDEGTGTWNKGPAIGPTDVITAVSGMTAQYVGIDIVSNWGNDYHVGLNQVHIVPVPEPATLALLGLGGLILRRKK